MTHAENGGITSDYLSVSYILIVLAPYLIWVLVSLWNSAFNVENKFWGYLIRIFVVLMVVDLAFEIVKSF